MKRGIFFILITALLCCSQETQELKVLALLPNVNSSTTYSCGEFEKFWSLNTNEQVVIDTFNLNNEKADKVHQLVQEITYKELIGGYQPIYKFHLENEEYCVVLLAVS